MPGDWPFAPGPWLALVAAVVAYGGGVAKLRQRGRAWSPWRTLSYAAGVTAVAVALVSPLASADDRLPAHMAQHLLLGMGAPLLLALSAPVTLALRTLPRPERTVLVGALHSRAVRLAAHPAVASGIFVAGLVGLYFTPLYGLTLTHPVLHEIAHVHFLVAGCLFAWAFVGLDPVPRRSSRTAQVGLLVAALAAHAVMGKLIYAGYGDVGPAAPGELRAGAELMYYGGDIFDVALVAAYCGQWYAAAGRRLRRDRRLAALRS